MCVVCCKNQNLACLTLNISLIVLFGPEITYIPTPHGSQAYIGDNHPLAQPLDMPARSFLVSAYLKTQ